MTIMQSALKTRSLVVSAAALSVISMSPAWANWQSSNDTKGTVGAQACVSGSSRLCVKLQCYAWKDGGVYWNIDAPEPDYSPESTSVRWAIDGRTVLHLQMTKGWPGDGIQAYEADFDRTAHQGLVDGLKSGNRLTVSSDQFVPFTVSLRGSGAVLNQTLADCPLLNTANNMTAQTAPGESFDQPFDAVKALMVAQDCTATEPEIFSAITNGGFGTWDANQFIVNAAENGTLELLDKTDDIHKYRLRGACP